MRSFSKAIALAALLSVSPVVAEVDPGVERQALESFTEDIDLTVTAPTLEAHRGGNGGNSIGSQFALIAKTRQRHGKLYAMKTQLQCASTWMNLNLY